MIPAQYTEQEHPHIEAVSLPDAPLPPPATFVDRDRLNEIVREGLGPNLRRFAAYLGHRDVEPIELQTLDAHGARAPYRGQGFAHAMTTDDVVRLAAEADDNHGAQGVYVVMNGIEPSITARGAVGQWNRQSKGSAASDRDIVCRRAFYVDADAVRASGISASGDEQARAVNRAIKIFRRFADILGDERALGLGMSGNGGQVYVALDDLAVDAQVESIVREMLAVASALFSDAIVAVDTSVRDAKRLAPAFGTTKRKGASTPERPHRRTWFVCDGKVRRLSLGELEDLLWWLRWDLTPEQAATVEKAMGRAPRQSAPAIKHAAAGHGDDTLARINRDCSIREVARHLGLDVECPTCPGCGATNSGSDVACLDDKGINAIKCLHATCNARSWSPVDLVAKIVFGVDDLKGTRGVAGNVIAWFAERFGTPRRAASVPNGSAATAEAGTAGDVGEVEAHARPVIRLSTERHLAVEAAIDALSADGDVYVREDRLVRVVERQFPEPARVVVAPIPLSVLASVHLSRCARWESWDKRANDFVACAPAPDVARAVHERGHWPKLRTLVAVLDTPALRPDGTILDAPGYDRATGILYKPAIGFPSVPENPTETEIQAALDALMYVVSDFPLLPSGRAAWLTLVLSYFARPRTTSPVPLYVLDKNAPGTGAGLLAKVTGLICLGRDMSLTVPTNDQEEQRKRISTVLLDADPMVLVDNQAPGQEFGSPVWDALLTTTYWVDRKLGSFEKLGVVARTIWVLSGNNVFVKNDTKRRAIIMRMETPLERPELRADFKETDLEAYVRENRAQLVNAALTLLRAWHVAGRPTKTVRLGSFESWSREVGDLVAWLGLGDVTATQAEYENRVAGGGRGTGDLGTLGVLLRALYDHFEGGEFRIADLVRALREEDARVASTPGAVHRLGRLREAVVSLATTKDNALPDAKVLGRKFGEVLMRVAGGLRLERSSDPDRNKVFSWRVGETSV